MKPEFAVDKTPKILTAVRLMEKQNLASESVRRYRDTLRYAYRKGVDLMTLTASTGFSTTNHTALLAEESSGVPTTDCEGSRLFSEENGFLSESCPVVSGEPGS